MDLVCSYSRIDVPLSIVPTPNIREPNLACLTKLPKLLSQEECECYQRTLDASGGDDLLTEIHNASGGPVFDDASSLSCTTHLCFAGTNSLIYGLTAWVFDQIEYRKT